MLSHKFVLNEISHSWKEINKFKCEGQWLQSRLLVTAATMIPFEINIRENRGTGQRQIKQKNNHKTKHNN